MFAFPGFVILGLLFSIPLAGEPTRVVCLGDSLTAGYGLDPSSAWPAVLEEQLREEGLAVEVRNAGISGDTTAGGLGRIDWVLSQPVDVLIIALGANDALRGLPVANTRENLDRIITGARDRHPEIRILLAGMLAPPNMGETYGEAFAAVFREIAKERDVAFLSFLLEGVAGQPGLNQADGIHPTAEGQAIIADLVKTKLKEAEFIGESPES